MKFVSKVVLASALVAGMGGMTLAVPAIAKDKKGEEKPGLKLSPEVLKAAQVAQPAMAAKDFATAETNIALVEAAAKTEDDKYIAAALRYDLESQKINARQVANPNAPVDESSLARPLEALLASPSTAPDAKGRYAYRRGALSFNAKQYPVALQYFAQAQKLGFTDPNLPLQIVRAKEGAGDMAGAMTDLEAVIAAETAAGRKSPEELYRYGIARNNAAKNAPATVSWLRKYVTAYPTTKNWRDALVTYGLQQNSVAKLDTAQKIDLFRLMMATNSLADQYDYEEYAQKVYDRGLPGETQAVLNAGKAAGKVPASSPIASSLLRDAANAIRQEGSMAGLETKAASAANGTTAAQTADAYLGLGNYAKAITLYRMALQKGGVNTDDVNTHLGIALARSGDKAGARTAFAEVKATPRADIAALWTTSLDSPPVG